MRFASIEIRVLIAGWLVRGTERIEEKQIRRFDPTEAAHFYRIIRIGDELFQSANKDHSFPLIPIVAEAKLNGVEDEEYEAKIFSIHKPIESYAFVVLFMMAK